MPEISGNGTYRSGILDEKEVDGEESVKGKKQYIVMGPTDSPIFPIYKLKEIFLL